MYKLECELCYHFLDYTQPTWKDNCKIASSKNDRSIIDLALLGFKCPWFKDKKGNDENER